jgi:hypothetical protein
MKPMMMKSMIRDAGPPLLKALPEPTNRPAPMEPPMAIICMCLPFRLRLRPPSPSSISSMIGAVPRGDSGSDAYFSLSLIPILPVVSSTCGVMMVRGERNEVKRRRNSANLRGDLRVGVLACFIPGPLPLC